MSCVEIMYQPYGASLPYPRTQSIQAFDVPRMHETLDVGSSFSGTISTTVKDEDIERDNVPKETHYLNANCILLTYFTGDISTVVDDHFSRALSQTTSFNVEGCANKNISCKDPSPWSQRNFPPSFWNSNYQHTAATAAASLMASHHDFQFPSNPYLPTSLHGLSGLHQDSWPYSHGVSYSHRPLHYDLPYPSIASTSRFSQNYGALFMQQSMRSNQLSALSGQCDFTKGSDSARPRFADPRLASDFPVAHTAISGLESSVSEAGKDLYWF